MRKIQATFLNVLITYVVTLLKFVEIIRIGFFWGTCLYQTELITNQMKKTRTNSFGTDHFVFLELLDFPLAESPVRSHEGSQPSLVSALL